MARGSVDKNYFQFTGGRITEASALTYPENSLLDEKNVEINYDGTLQRRRGIQSHGSLVQVDSINVSNLRNLNTYVWDNPGNEKDLSVLVVVTDTEVMLYDMSADPVVTGLLDTLTLTRTVSLSASEDNKRPDIDLIEAKDSLIIVGSNVEPSILEYDLDTSSFSLDTFEIEIRDFDGIAKEGFDRTDTLPAWKLYDLSNQGWILDSVRYSERNGAVYYPATITLDYKPIELWKKVHNSRRGSRKFPSSYDAFLDVYTGVSVDQDLCISQVTKDPTANPSKGHYIIKAFNQERTIENTNQLSYPTSPTVGVTVTDPYISSVNDTSHGVVYETPVTDERPTTVEYFQGHLCFSGVDSLGFEDAVFVSQSLIDISKAGFCYSVNDPTKDIESSPLDTDGGVIRISGANRIKTLKVVGSSLVVFADNGIWAISSVPDSVFTVNSFSVNKLSSEGVPSGNSIVAFQGSLFCWGYSAIYAITAGDLTSGPQIQDLTESTIQTDYNNINNLQKSYCKGVMDTDARKVYWLYDSDLDSTADFRFRYNRALVLDLRVQGFYNLEISSNGTSIPFICGAFYKDQSQIADVENTVVVGADTVQVGGVDVVVANSSTSFNNSSDRLVFLCMTEYTTGDTTADVFTASFSNRDFLDWATMSSPGVSYDSYIETGYELVGDAMRKKKIENVFFYFNRTEENFVDNGSGGVEFDYPSSCKVRVKWDWTSSGSANRWSKEQQAYRFRRNYVSGAIGDPFDYDFDVIVSKLRARGNGKSLRIRCESENGKDFQLLGWAVTYTASAMA